MISSSIDGYKESRAGPLLRLAIDRLRMQCEVGLGIPVILFAEPPLHAEIRIRSSMMLSLILLLPDCTTNTSFSRMLVRIFTLVSPCVSWLADLKHPPQRTVQCSYICKLRELYRSRSCAQVGAYLARELGAGAPRENQSVAHF